MPARLRRGTSATPSLSRCLESWLLALSAEGRSPATLHVYRHALGRLRDALADPPVDQITSDDIRRFYVTLRESGLKPATIATMHQVIRTFCGWAQRDGLLTGTSPLQNVNAPKRPETEPRGFSDDEVLRMLATCNTKHALGARDRAIMVTAWATALRVGELVQLTKADVEKLPTARAPVVRVMGKGKRERSIVLGHACREAIALYLMRRGEDNEPALWLGERGRLSISGLQLVVTRAGNRAGVAGAHIHRFRNTAAIAMLHAGMAAESVQRITGHRNIKQLQHYVGSREQERANEALLAAEHVEKVLKGQRPGKRRR